MPLRAAPSDAGNDPSRVDSEWILSKLVQPAPARTSFVELRGSKLLKKPLRLQGEYLRPDADTLVRKVAAPYAETTTIRPGHSMPRRIPGVNGSTPAPFRPQTACRRTSYSVFGNPDVLASHRHCTPDCYGRQSAIRRADS